MFASVFHFFWNFTGPYLMGMVASGDATGRIAVLMPAAQTGGFAAGTALAGNLMTEDSLVAANGVRDRGLPDRTGDFRAGPRSRRHAARSSQLKPDRRRIKKRRPSV